MSEMVSGSLNKRHICVNQLLRADFLCFRLTCPRQTQQSSELHRVQGDCICAPLGTLSPHCGRDELRATPQSAYGQSFLLHGINGCIWHVFKTAADISEMHKPSKKNAVHKPTQKHDSEESPRNVLQGVKLWGIPGWVPFGPLQIASGSILIMYCLQEGQCHHLSGC